MFYAVGPTEVLSGFVVGADLFPESDLSLSEPDLAFAEAAAPNPPAVPAAPAAAPNSAAGSVAAASYSTAAGLTLYNVNKRELIVANGEGTGSDVASFVTSEFQGKLMGGNEITIKTSMNDKASAAYSQVYLDGNDLYVITGCPGLGGEPSAPSRSSATGTSTQAAATTTDACSVQRGKTKELLGYFLDESRDASQALKDCKFVSKPTEFSACYVCGSTTSTVCPPPNGVKSRPGGPTSPSVSETPTSSTGAGNCKEPAGYVACNANEFSVDFYQAQGSVFAFSSKNKAFQLNLKLKNANNQPLPLKDANVRMTVSLYAIDAEGNFGATNPLSVSLCYNKEKLGGDSEKTCDITIPSAINPVMGTGHLHTFTLDKLGIEMQQSKDVTSYSFTKKSDTDPKTNSFKVQKGDKVRVKVYLRQWFEASGQKKYCSTPCSLEGRSTGILMDFALPDLKDPKKEEKTAAPTTNPFSVKGKETGCTDTTKLAGKCQDVKTACNGNYVTGLCLKPGQGADIRCCVLTAKYAVNKEELEPFLYTPSTKN